MKISESECVAPASVCVQMVENCIACYEELNTLYIWTRRIVNRDMSDCCIEQPTSVRFGVQTAISGLVASVVLLSQTDMVSALFSIGVPCLYSDV